MGREGTGPEVKEKEITISGNELTDYASILQLIGQGKGRIPETRVEESLRFLSEVPSRHS